MISSLSLRVKPQLKGALARIIDETYAGHYPEAVVAAQEMRSYISQHYVSRGLPYEDVLELVRRLEYWLRLGYYRRSPPDAVIKEMLRITTDLRNKLVRPLPADPIEALKVIFAELVQEDYPHWIDSRSSGDWDAVLDDFSRIESLEPKFSTLDRPNKDAIYSRFREILTAIGQCASLAATPAKSDKSWATVTSGFSNLFQKIEVLFAPENLTVTTAGAVSPPAVSEQ